MKQTSILRVTADICFFYAILSAISVFQAWRLPMALFATACLLLGLIIVRLNNPVPRILLALLPGLCFLIGPFSLLMIVPLLAWLYYFIVMVRGHFAMPLDEYRRNFTFMLVVSLFFIAANIANAAIYTHRFISVDALIYIAVFLFLGILAMRRMQMGAEMNLKWRLRNFLSVAGIPILAVGAALLVFLFLRFSHQALAAILVPVGRFFIWLFNKLFPVGDQPVDETTILGEITSHNVQQQAVEAELGSNGRLQEEHWAEHDFKLFEQAAAVGGWILLGLLLVVVLVLIWRYAKRNQLKEEDELLYDETEDIPGESRRRGANRRRTPLLAGNARQLRRVYKTYLEYRKSKGMSVHPSDTSAEILKHDLEMSESDDAIRLRELYLAARYGNPSAITNEQVQEAQACLERITG